MRLCASLVALARKRLGFGQQSIVVFELHGRQRRTKAERTVDRLNWAPRAQQSMRRRPTSSSTNARSSMMALTSAPCRSSGNVVDGASCVGAGGVGATIVSLTENKKKYQNLFVIRHSSFVTVAQTLIGNQQRLLNSHKQTQLTQNNNVQPKNRAAAGDNANLVVVQSMEQCGASIALQKHEHEHEHATNGAVFCCCCVCVSLRLSRARPIREQLPQRRT